MREQGDSDELNYTFAECETAYSCESRLPEQSLWNAVIYRAFTDAAHGSKAAREWLLNEKEDFITVCSLAGVSPFSVRAAARRII